MSRSSGFIRPLTLSDAAVGAWSELADRALEPNPFARPEFVLPAVRERRSDVLLAVVEDQGRWLACLPVRLVAACARLRLPCFAPWWPAYSYLATPLVDREHARVAADALIAVFRSQQLAAGLVLDPIDPAGPVARTLLASLNGQGVAPVVHTEFERAALRRRPERTYLDEAVSAAGRKKLRKSARGLARELDGELTVVDRSTDPGAYDAFLAMEHGGWKAAGGTALLSRPGDARFFRAMCDRMAAAGLLQILSLEAAGRTVAMQCNLRDGASLSAFKVAFDRSFARFSPGALLEVEAIDAFHDDLRLDFVDSCAAPDSPLVNRLWPDRRRMQTLLVPASQRLGVLVRPAARADAAARRAKRTLRRARAGAGANRG